MQKITADLIITNTGDPLQNHTIILDGEKIVDIVPISEAGEVAHHQGVITPGFINSHCHLELSHLKGQIDTGTGLIPFIKGVVTLREFPQEEILAAIYAADQEMYDAGIVAVGDICNKPDTKERKEKSKIRYYSFVEMFDFLQDQNAQQVYEGYHDVYGQQSDQGGNKKSCVPHAPYSVSPHLFSLINVANKGKGTVSIHNQELAAENEFFMSKTGGFVDFYRDFGIPIDGFSPTGTRSIDYAMQYMDPSCRTLFVHNTQTDRDDVARANDWSNNIYWATCPNANLYIENRLPDYQVFIDTDAKVCIGTDSLSSNWKLSILSEMMTIKKYQSGISDTEIIKWATLHGAEALGYDDLGLLERGLAPGINLIDVAVDGHRFDLSQARGVRRLA